MTYRDMLAGLGPPPVRLAEKMTKAEALAAELATQPAAVSCVRPSDWNLPHELFFKFPPTTRDIDPPVISPRGLTVDLDRDEHGRITGTVTPSPLDELARQADQRDRRDGILGYEHSEAGAPAFMTTCGVNKNAIALTYADGYSVALTAGMKAILPGGGILSVKINDDGLEYIFVTLADNGIEMPVGLIRDFEGYELAWLGRNGLHRWQRLLTAEERRREEKTNKSLPTDWLARVDNLGIVGDGPSPALSRKALASVSQGARETKASPNPPQPLENMGEDVLRSVEMPQPIADHRIWIAAPVSIIRAGQLMLKQVDDDFVRFGFGANPMRPITCEVSLSPVGIADVLCRDWVPGAGVINLGSVIDRAVVNGGHAEGALWVV